MYFADHPPPHFHVRYGEHKAVVAIRDLHILEGRLPPRVLGLVIEWASTHQNELIENWSRVSINEPPEKIAPLE